MTYYDRLNVIYRKFALDPPPVSAQLIMLYLLHINNCHGNAGTFRCSDRYLQNLTGLSKDAITQAKRYLKNKGYLDFKSDKKEATLYVLEQGTEQGRYKGEVQGVNRDALLDKDLDKDLNSNNNKARARENLSVPSKEALNTWEECKGEKLVGAKLQGLTDYENACGTEKIMKAMITASESNDYNKYPLVTYNFFKKVLENQLKEGEGNDRRRVSEETERHGVREGACKDAGDNGNESQFTDDAARKHFGLDG